jgi:hypothetical protein
MLRQSVHVKVVTTLLTCISEELYLNIGDHTDYTEYFVLFRGFRKITEND